MCKFQTLIGILQTASGGELGKTVTVSNPYRYSTNLFSKMQPMNAQEKVSNPYRYSTNTDALSVIAVKFPFQTLIGILQTSLGCHNGFEGGRVSNPYRYSTNMKKRIWNCEI